MFPIAASGIEVPVAGFVALLVGAFLLGISVMSIVWLTMLTKRVHSMDVLLKEIQREADLAKARREEYDVG